MLEHKMKLIKKSDESYSITISGENNFQERLEAEVNKIKPSQTAIITDSNLAKIYAEDLEKLVKKNGWSVITYKAGEASKNISTVMSLFSELASRKFDRKSLIIAFGGGVTGDMAGFLASIYLRGIPFIQVPTSLLAMVDSSIGGKTGVDTPEGKNLLGSFNQPKAVLIHAPFLKTLSETEFINGMAEVIKHAVIVDRAYFDFIKAERSKILSRDMDALIQTVWRSCQIKGNVVEKDEKESGLRQTLNFGHTIGHAVENASHYNIPHGYAISIGMVAECAVSLSQGIMKTGTLDEVKNILSDYGLLRFKDELKHLNNAQIMDSAFSDKKNTNKTIKAVMIQDIGKVYRKGKVYSFSITEDEITTGLNTI